VTCRPMTVEQKCCNICSTAAGGLPAATGNPMKTSLWLALECCGCWHSCHWYWRLGGSAAWQPTATAKLPAPTACYVMLHVLNVRLRDKHCPSQTGHRAHATQTQTGPSLLQPEPADRNGLALETGNSSGQQRTGVKARARAPPSRRGEDARCSKHTGGQATMHAKHDDKDAKQGNL
jgi:hypothetical protein